MTDGFLLCLSQRKINIQIFSKNIRWVKTETAPQFYHETTAKSKTQRLLALNSVENLVKNVENLVKNVPKKAVTLKRSQPPLSPNDEPKIKQSKNGLSQRPENISTATRQNISTAPRQKNTIGKHPIKSGY